MGAFGFPIVVGRHRHLGVDEDRSEFRRNQPRQVPGGAGRLLRLDLRPGGGGVLCQKSDAAMCA